MSCAKHFIYKYGLYEVVSVYHLVRRLLVKVSNLSSIRTNKSQKVLDLFPVLQFSAAVNMRLNSDGRKSKYDLD